MESWDEIRADRLKKARRMPFYWIWYFKACSKIFPKLGIYDMVPYDTLNPVSRWIGYHIVSPSLQKFLDLKRKGYY